jgi:hypothetical protein
MELVRTATKGTHPKLSKANDEPGALAATRPIKVAAIALANKIAHVAFAPMVGGTL